MLHLILRKKYIWPTLHLFVISRIILDVNEVFTQNYACFYAKLCFFWNKNILLKPEIYFLNFILLNYKTRTAPLYYSPDIILLFVGVNKKRWEYYQQPQAEAEDALDEVSTVTTLLISILEPPVVA